MLRHAWLLGVLILFSSSSWSADYYWLHVDSGRSGPDPKTACINALHYYNNYVDEVLPSSGYTNATTWTCYTKAPSNPNTSVFYIQRFGDSCPPNTTYDPTAMPQCAAPPPNIGEQCGTDSAGKPQFINSQGECVASSELDQAAVCKALSDKGTVTKRVFVAFDSDGNPQAPAISDKFGCVAELALTGVDHCKLPAGKSEGGVTLVPNGAMCTVFVNFTGEVSGDTGSGYPLGNPAAGVEGVCPNPDQCLAPEPPILKESKPCNYMSDGQIVGCESQAFEGNPGEMNCGIFSTGGTYECRRKEPTSNGIQIATQIETKANGDGTTTTTKTDTITQTKCIGANSCVTNVSNNKTTVVKDGNGNTLSTGTQCTGPACSSGGKGDSDGDGVKDCVTGNCEEEEGGEYGAPEMPELEETEEIGDSTSAYYARILNAPIVQAVTSISVPTGGTCPTGTADTFMGAISFDTFCQLAPQVLAGLVWLFRAIWAWAAIRLFFTA